MKDLIIGCSHGYNWENLKLWVKSINSCGFDGDKVLIVKDCDEQTIKIIQEHNFTVIRADRSIVKNTRASELMPIHVERFLYIYDFLKNNQYRYVITTDVRDVVFQKNPVEFVLHNINDKNLLFASESILYKDETWGNKNLHKTFGDYIYNDFRDKEIYNVGVLAGKWASIRDLCLNIFIASHRGGTPICDQSTFNVMISMSPYLETSLYLKSVDAWAAQIGTLNDPKKINDFKDFLLEKEPIISNNSVLTSEGKEFYIVHQYDRNKFMKKIIEERFL